jgi:hypothetical protein
VQTASVTQVRRPIYRDSIGRWRPYQDVLRPLLDALGIDAVAESKRSFTDEISQLATRQAP